MLAVDVTLNVKTDHLPAFGEKAVRPAT